MTDKTAQKTNETMKAMVCTKYGPPEVFELREVKKPRPGDREVLIKIHATTVTAGDCELRRFEMPPLFWLPLRFFFGLTKPRFVLGQEFSGTIVETGKDVTTFQPGDQVFAPTGMKLGAYAEYICLPENHAIAVKPDTMSFGEAAALPTGGLNAIYFISAAEIRSGEHVLINGAGGSIGTYATQMVKALGAEVTAVDSTEKLDMLTSIGADHVIDYTRENFKDTNKNYDVIFDVAGKNPFSGGLKALKKNGRYIMANPGLTVMLGKLWYALAGKKVITGIAGYTARDIALLLEYAEKRTITPVIDRVSSFEELPEAHRYVESGHKKGNLVITLS